MAVLRAHIGRVWFEALVRNGVSSEIIGRYAAWIAKRWACSEIIEAARLVMPSLDEAELDRRVAATAVLLEEIRVTKVNVTRLAKRARECTSLGYPLSPSDILRAAVAAALGYLPARFMASTVNPDGGEVVTV